ncbi:hypothetical protein [Bacillus phage vB_BanS-Thrax3]|nr:hypothetical protein [Bacillus phage vB_BanS-Thrax3]
MITIKESYDDDKCWNVLQFFEDSEEVGKMNITVFNNEITLYSIESYKKGYGSKMVSYLKSIKGVKYISGDIGNDTHAFWMKLGAIVSDDEFKITIE